MSKQTQKKNRKTSTNVKATFLFAALIAAFIIAMGMINFTGVAYAAGPALPEEFDSTGVATSTRFEFIPGVGFMADITATVSGTVYQLYCLELDKNFPSGYGEEGATLVHHYHKNSETATCGTDHAGNPKPCIDQGIIYILTHGYNQNPSFLPGSPYTNDARKYVTQMAIWYYQGIRDNGINFAGDSNHTKGYLNTTEVSLINGNSVYGSQIKKLAMDALDYNGKSHEPTISVDEDSIKYVVNGDYLETNYISPSYSEDLQSYTITLPADSLSRYDPKLIDENGKEITSTTEIPAGKKFKLRIPMSKVRNTNSIEINGVLIKGTFEIKKAYSYLPADSQYQTILYAAYETTTLPTQADFNFNIPTAPVKISKQDITNSAEVPGASLVIKDCYGNTVASWVSTDKPHYIEALPYYGESCKYKLTETIAPKGYELSKTTVEFNVKESGEVTSVVMTNTPTTKSPDTGSNIPWFVYLIGILAIGAGIVVVATNVYEQKQKA